MEKYNINFWKEKFETYLVSHPTDDGSHDLSHFKRVWTLADKLSDAKDDKLVILAASYFHDIVSYPKNHPKRSQSSVDAAIKAREILKEMDFPEEKLDHIAHCIEAHSFSANIKPETIEAGIVQDSDRMESLGAIGIARTFYVAGRLGSNLFDGDDPLAKNRELDDKKYALDHFKTKLLSLPATMQTESGKSEAERRAKILVKFSEDLLLELGSE